MTKIFYLVICVVITTSPPLTFADDSDVNPIESFQCPPRERIALRDEVSVSCEPIVEPSDTALITGQVKIFVEPAEKIQKKQLFEELVKEAIADSNIQRLKAFEFLGGGMILNWDEEHIGCYDRIKDDPTLNFRLRDFIDQRNERYKALSPDVFRQKKEEEFDDYVGNLYDASRHMTHLMGEFDVLLGKRRLLQLSRSPGDLIESLMPRFREDEMFPFTDEERVDASERSALYEQSLANIDEELAEKRFQIGLIRESYPILQTVLKEGEHPLFLELYKEIPARRLVRQAIKKAHDTAYDTIRGNPQAGIPGLCNLQYSDEMLKRFLNFDKLTDRIYVKFRHDRQMQLLIYKLLCEIEAERKEGTLGWSFYLGGAALSCGLGWVVTGPGACAAYAATFGLGAGAYETLMAIDASIEKNKEYREIERFFLSGIEGSPLVTAERVNEAYQEYSDWVKTAWLSGVFSVGDLGALAKLAAPGLKQGFGALSNFNTFSRTVGKQRVMGLARRVLEKSRNPKVLFKLFSEVPSEKQISGFLDSVSKLSDRTQRAVFSDIAQGNLSRIKRLPCFSKIF